MLVTLHRSNHKHADPETKRHTAEADDREPDDITSQRWRRRLFVHGSGSPRDRLADYRSTAGGGVKHPQKW
jgi:hypothetical protein